MQNVSQAKRAGTSPLNRPEHQSVPSHFACAFPPQNDEIDEKHFACASVTGVTTRRRGDKRRDESSSTMPQPPLRMALSAKMEAAARDLSKAMFRAVDIADGTVTPAESPEPLSRILPSVSGESGALCFVVRRPG